MESHNERVKNNNKSSYRNPYRTCDDDCNRIDLSNSYTESHDKRVVSGNGIMKSNRPEESRNEHVTDSNGIVMTQHTGCRNHV